jgi:hypothetical protein
VIVQVSADETRRPPDTTEATPSGRDESGQRAAAFATSEAACTAIPTSACFRAGASFRAVTCHANNSACSLKRLHGPEFSSGIEVGKTIELEWSRQAARGISEAVAESNLVADGLGRIDSIACHHEDLDAK